MLDVAFNFNVLRASVPDTAAPDNGMNNCSETESLILS
jgi:hypothetical protein